MGQAITPEERSTFQSIPLARKADSMEAYLIGVNGCRYNMSEVGEMVFGAQNYSYTVSLIHRCYNFSGQNSGRYGNGCAFERKYGYRVTRKDIEAFLRQYPNGTFQNGVTFEQFLLSRLNAAPGAGASRTSAAPRRQREADVWSGPGYDDTADPDGWRGSSTNNDIASQRKIWLMILIATILVLVFLFRTGGLFRHWILSLICVILAMGSFFMLRES